MLGVLLAGNLAYIGRWSSMMLCSILIIIGSSFCLFYKISFYLFLSGRFIYGIATGAITCFCPKYINECSPKELSGPAGAMFQFMTTFGSVLPYFIVFPFDVATATTEQMDHLTFFLFGFPIILALVQMLLLVFFFKFDTPVMMR
jgi:MFS family permease